MINWGNFGAFFKTGIPSVVIYTSLLVAFAIVCYGLLSKNIRNKRHFSLWVLLMEYMFIVLCSTIICRGVQSFEFARLELTPFWTYKAVLAHMPGVSVWDIILNVVLFIPLGFLVKSLYPQLRLSIMVLIAFCCSLFIETNQYLFEKGIVQIDDVMHNTIGAMIGWVIALVFVNASKKFKKVHYSR